MRHHTKDKGDAGLGFVIADLLAHNIQVALPISEHLPFDCIAISEKNALVRLSVKYRKLSDGCLKVPLKSTWADKHGVHIRRHDKASYDAVAVYCPDMGTCYYVRLDEVGRMITIRVRTPKNNQKRKILLAEGLIDPRRLFASIA